jgi:hypothetical protein
LFDACFDHLGRKGDSERDRRISWTSFGVAGEELAPPIKIDISAIPKFRVKA